ncbi:RIM21 (YNL294C) [Zygosaccharomyces parabailii]|nr:RIM21 (YNL294C) [Zygosaccharomyces parabailii]CDH12942.1 related to pH-response regulator protein palH/RIM21 [Zygosaccharomyces bailii ISA1307]
MVGYSPWEKQVVSKHSYVSCKKQNLGSGLLVGDILPDTITFIDEALFQSYCEHERPVYNTAKDGASAFHYLDIVIQDWNKYLLRNGPHDGSFSYGVYPVVLSFTANFVITVFLTLLIFLNINGKRYKYASRSLKLGSIICSVNIVIFVTRALKKMQEEHEKYGVATAKSIMSMYTSDLTFSILDLISVFMIQLCQVAIINRLFSRNLEKRIVIFLGVPLVVVSNVLWAIPRFADGVKDSTHHWETLPPFVYLFRIALSTSYACAVTSFAFIKRRFCIQSFQMGILTLLALLVVVLQPALFLADVSDAWLRGVGELFNTTCYVGSAFIVWEWLEGLNSMERNEQAKSILGRPIYEDEQQNYQVAKYALQVQRALGKGCDDEDEFERASGFLQDAQSSDVSCSLDFSNTMNSRESLDQVRFSQKPAFKDVMRQRLDDFYCTVNIYAKQLKQDGIQLVKFNSKKKAASAEDERVVRKRIGLDRSNEVYIYSTKDIVFESDGE